MTALSKIPALSEAKPDLIRSVSIVIPVYNEAANLEPLWRRLSAVISGSERDYEVVFVDDGSTDESLGILRVGAGLIGIC